jgi:hypothetical protein
MRHEDRRAGAVSLSGIGLAVLLWVFGELKVHPPRIVLYALLAISTVLIVGPWIAIWRHHRRHPAEGQPRAGRAELPSNHACSAHQPLCGWEARRRRRDDSA